MSTMSNLVRKTQQPKEQRISDANRKVKIREFKQTEEFKAMNISQQRDYIRRKFFE